LLIHRTNFFYSVKYDDKDSFSEDSLLIIGKSTTPAKVTFLVSPKNINLDHNVTVNATVTDVAPVTYFFNGNVTQDDIFVLNVDSSDKNECAMVSISQTF